MAESGNESDFASAESDQEGQVQSQSETAAIYMESRSGEEDTTGKGGGGVVLGKTSTSQSTDKKATKSESGQEGEKDPKALSNESDDCARMETENISPDSTGDQDIVEEGVKSEKEKENKTASEKESSQRVPTQTATEAAGSIQAEEGGPRQKAQEGGDGGGWTWGGFSNIWSSVSTMTESTAHALGEKVSSVIASVEDTLGLPSPHELAQEEGERGEVDEETSRLAEEILEHDIPPEDQPPVQEEPHLHSIPDTQKLEQDQQAQEQHSPGTYDSFAGFFSGIASAVQTTGKGLVSGGLDALETLGKKTMEVLSEGDPGLRKKRSMLGSGEAPTLSQLLMEAKSEAESVAKMREGKGDVDSTQLVLSYSRLFDEYQGVVHLEALELLSKECESKIRSRLSNLSGEEMQSLKGELDKISQALKVEELPEVLDDDSSHLSEVLELFSDITLPLKVDKLIKVSNSWREKVESTSSASPAEEKMGEEEAGGETAVEEKTRDKKTGGEKREGETAEEEKAEGERTEGEKAGEEKTEGERTGGDKTGGEKDESTEAEQSEKSNEKNEQRRVACRSLYESGLRSLVELTSVSIELFRKMAEVSLLPDVQKTSALEQAQKLNRLTVLVSSELDSLASVHAEAITILDVKDSNSSVTSLYLEASNSSSYVQDAFQLLCPVLQLTVLQQSLTQEPPANVHIRS